MAGPLKLLKLRLAFLAALMAACSGTSKSDFLGPGGAEPNVPAATNEDEPSPPPTGSPDAGANVKPKPSVDAASPPPPTQPKNPLDGASELTKVQSGFGQLEGPLWRASAKALLFSDLDTDSIERFAPPSTFNTYRFPSGGSNGLALDPQGRLIACEGKNRRVTRTTSTGMLETIASSYQGYALNAPNDVVVRSDGTIYFTDPDYSVYGNQELAFNGVYSVGTNGAIHLIADDMSKPNGIALSPTGSTLYVSDESAGFIRAYDVATDGSTSNPRKFAEAPHPDGIAVDDDGNLYAAVETGIVIYKPDGSAWGTIAVPKQPANCAFGGLNRKTLYVTALDSLYQIELAVSGPP